MSGEPQVGDRITVGLRTYEVIEPSTALAGWRDEGRCEVFLHGGDHTWFQSIGPKDVVLTPHNAFLNRYQYRFIARVVDIP